MSCFSTTSGGPALDLARAMPPDPARALRPDPTRALPSNPLRLCRQRDPARALPPDPARALHPDPTRALPMPPDPARALPPDPARALLPGLCPRPCQGSALEPTRGAKAAVPSAEDNVQVWSFTMITYRYDPLSYDNVQVWSSTMIMYLWVDPLHVWDYDM